MIPTLGEFAQAVTAGALAYNIWQTWRVKNAVIEVKKQTDGITEKLVSTAEKASLAEGKAAGLVEGHADGLEQGRNEERK